MSITTKLTVQKLTPPGYFDLTESAPAKHKDYMTWFQNVLTWMSGQSAALQQLILTPWLVSWSDSPRAPWLNYLLNSYGMGFFGGTNSQAAYLYALIFNAWSKSVIVNIQTIIDTLCLPPFSWFESNTLVVYSWILVPSITDTGFLIYTTNPSPATPANTPYTTAAGQPGSWSTPGGWTRAAASAVKYCAGYMVGSTIVWCAPRPVADFANATYFSAAVPLSVSGAGTWCIVNNDSTGDICSVYYSDGSVWRKNSTINANLGLVPGDVSLPPTGTMMVFAPDPSSVSYVVASDTPPPLAGPTQGYGAFEGLGDTPISNGEISLSITQIAGGSIAIATLIAVLRKIKPISQNLIITINGTQHTVNDARTVS